MIRKLFLAAAATLMFAIAFHLGAVNAGAQGGAGSPVVGVFPGTGAQVGVVAANGDVYVSMSGSLTGPFALACNVFSGGAPVAAQRATWTDVKARYR